MQDMGFRPLIVIRFNPDEYTDHTGKKVTSCWGVDKNGNIRIKPSKRIEYNMRLDKLKTTIEYWLEHVPEKEVTEIKLFYDKV